MLTAVCGVLGGGPDAAPALDAMLDALADYGPERQVWTDGTVRIGYRAQAGNPVEDPDAGASALAVNQAAGLALAADVRIDDRNALCSALGIPRPQRSGLADAGLLLRAFAHWGEACPGQLIGDYAFAVWDRRRSALFCARDPVGARPFYYALEDGRLVFASAVEAVLAAPGVSVALDEELVAAQLSSPWPDMAARTCFRAVRKLPAGHALVFKSEVGPNASGAGRLRVRLQRHWRPEETPEAQPASDDAYAEQFLDLYGKAVRDRLRDGPVGVHLSGGLDSSSITALAARELRLQGRPPPAAFSWLPDLGGTQPRPEHAREYALVDAVCARAGVRAFHDAPGPEEVLEVLRLDGTLPGAGVLFNEEVVLRRAAAMGVRVLLSGAGGDECVSFNGRGHWERLLLSGRWRKLAAECHAQDGAKRMLANKALALLHPALPPALNRWRKGWGLIRRYFIEPEFARRTKPLVRPAVRTIGVRRTQLLFLQDGRLSGFQEQWRARAMRLGIEYRFPLLDRRLLEFALGLPPEQFRRLGHNRCLMRHALRSVLPPEVCRHRSKADPARFGALQDAIAKALPVVRRRLLDRLPSRAPYIDMPALLDRLDRKGLPATAQFAPLRAALQFLDF